MVLLDLFAGIGGFSLAARWMGWQTAAFVEKEPFCQEVLRKNFPGIPIYDDVREYKGEFGTADIICGGFPCQDVSTAGHAAGIEGERSSLYKELLRIVCEIRPRYVVMENVSVLLGRGLGQVLGALSKIGYDAEWRVFSACELGLPHTRERVFIIAYSHGEFGIDRFCLEGCGASITGRELPGQWSQNRHIVELASGPDSLLSTWSQEFCESPLMRMDDGLPNGLDRIKALGNSIVPQIAFEIFRAIDAAEKTK
jgi:DNA (cytosine-5)-methyltransferase 1